MIADDNLIEIYRRTTYSVKDANGSLIDFVPAEDAKLPILLKKRFAIITAFNPMNQIQSPAVNEIAHECLRKELIKRPYEFYESMGRLEDHKELSFTVEGVSESEAISLAREFSQHAILYNDEQGIRFPLC